MWLSQYAPKGVKSLCITSSQTVYVRKPDLVSSKTLQRLGGRLICEIYLNTYFQRARLGGRLICELGLYANIYGTALTNSACPLLLAFLIIIPKSACYQTILFRTMSFHSYPQAKSATYFINMRAHYIQIWYILTLKVLNFWKFTSYSSLKPLWSGMGDVVPARTSPTLHPPSPPTVHQLSWLAF